jgi:hypothetical protein
LKFARFHAKDYSYKTKRLKLLSDSKQSFQSVGVIECS